VRYWPLTNSFFLLGVLTSVPILVKIYQEMRPWECPQTDRYTDTLTDANRFHNLSHAICYSYGTDNEHSYGTTVYRLYIFIWLSNAAGYRPKLWCQNCWRNMKQWRNVPCVIFLLLICPRLTGSFASHHEDRRYKTDKETDKNKPHYKYNNTVSTIGLW